MIKFKKFDPDFLRFTKAEQKGIYVLLAIMAVGFIIRLGYSYFSKTESASNPIVHEEFLAWIAIDSIEKTKATLKSESTEKFYFDPNLATEEELLRLGFRPSIARNLIKYREKGGKFKKAEDLKKLYGLQESFYNQIAPFVRVAQLQTVNEPTTVKKDTQISIKPLAREKSVLSIELNSADTTELKRLPGIGSILAQRIVSFRGALGGFCTIQQMEEIYGITPETIEKITPYIKVDISLVEKIPLNDVSLAELSKHPYFRTGIGKRLINYRTQHGPYKSLESVKTAGMIDDQLWPKISVYMTIEQLE